MKLLLGGYLLVLLAISMIHCMPKRKYNEENLDVGQIFVSEKGDKYRIDEELQRNEMICVLEVTRVKNVKITDSTEGSTSQTSDTDGHPNSYILKIDEGSVIDTEMSFFNALKENKPGKDGFPKVVEHGDYLKEDEDENSFLYKYIIMTRLGSDLFNHFEENMDDFTLSYIHRIALDMVDNLEVMHDLNFAHRDIKPANMCLPKSPGEKHALIDFGSVARIIETKEGWFVKEKEIIGTFGYMSRRAHEGKALCAQSDMESLALVILSFINPNVPWTDDDLVIALAHTDTQRIQLKIDFWTDIEDMEKILTTGGLPFLPFFEAVRDLEPGKPVNHAHLREILTQMHL